MHLTQFLFLAISTCEQDNCQTVIHLPIICNCDYINLERGRIFDFYKDGYNNLVFGH